METILISIFDYASTQEEIDRVQKFIKQIGLESNKNLIERIQIAESNLQWADQYVPIIKNAIKRNSK